MISYHVIQASALDIRNGDLAEKVENHGAHLFEHQCRLTDLDLVLQKQGARLDEQAEKIKDLFRMIEMRDKEIALLKSELGRRKTP